MEDIVAGSLSVAAAAALVGREGDHLYVPGPVAALEAAEAALKLEGEPPGELRTI
jgi:hypothetical protein